MYKVFFNDRTVFLTDEFTRYFEEKYGLFYKYRNKEDLTELLWFYEKLTSIDTLYLFHFDIKELQDNFKACFRFIEAAGGLVRNAKGELLAIKRLGKYDLPKGKLEKGESYQKAAVREVEEECGISELLIKRNLISTYHTYMLDGKMVLKKTYWFEMFYPGNAKPVPQTEESIENAFWMDVSDIQAFASNTYGTLLDVLKYSKLLALNVAP